MKGDIHLFVYRLHCALLNQSNYYRCPRRDSDPAEYPVALLDPGQCARQLLEQICASLPTKPVVDQEQRNAEIYQRYLQGELMDTLAETYDLSLSRIR